MAEGQSAIEESGQIFEDGTPLEKLRKEAEEKILKMIIPPEPLMNYAKATPEALISKIRTKSRLAWQVKGLVVILASIASVLTLPDLKKDPAQLFTEDPYRLYLGASPVAFVLVLLAWVPRIKKKPPVLKWLWMLFWFTAMQLPLFIWHASHSSTQVILYGALQLLVSITITVDTYVWLPRDSTSRAWYFFVDFVLHLTKIVFLVMPLMRSDWKYCSFLALIAILDYAATVTHFRANLARHCLTRKLSLNHGTRKEQIENDENLLFLLSVEAVLDHFWCHDKYDYERIVAAFSIFPRSRSAFDIESLAEKPTFPGLER